jgi:hypothetical protein
MGVVPLPSTDPADAVVDGAPPLTAELRDLLAALLPATDDGADAA